ncbi:DUF4382 domain-containing protein [Roseivirga sp.]|uniref:DUF4382 domain-containing protein n=1 Tax=Roseivirga sp. TaxID=1964215 RepID=UPI003B51C6FB
MNTLLRKLLSLLLLFFFFGCSEDPRDTTSGHLNVSVTDAPFRTDLVQSATVTIYKVEARNKGKEEGSPFMTLFEGETEINLLELTNGVTSSLVDVEVPVGNYDLVRIYISEASIKLKNGETYDVTVPSGDASGLKIFISPAIEVAGGLTADLLLDFDVSRSFVLKGPADNPNGFNFRPTIKAANLSSVGSLKGTVSGNQGAPLNGAEVAVYAADTLNTTTFTNSAGEYAVLGLIPGDYEITYSFGELTPITKEGVEIVVANQTTVDVQFE